MTLAGRRIVVTGAGGIGAAVARAALAGGAAVFLVDADPGRLDALALDLGVGTCVADLTDDAATDAAILQAARSLSGLDGLVAVAGGSGRRHGDGPSATLTAAAIRATLDLNALPPLLALAAFLRHADDDPRPPAASDAPRPQRSAVLVGSVLAGHPAPGFDTHAYAFAKAGIEGLTRAAAARYAGDGVRVNAVAPGLVRTPMSARAQADPDVRAFARTKQPLTRDGFVDPDAVADACVWLLRAHEVTGQVVAVDGGWGVC